MPAGVNVNVGINALCQKYGGVLATYAQLKSAWDQGADWCAWGIVEDTALIAYAVRTYGLHTTS